MRFKALLAAASLAAFATTGCTPVDRGFGETLAYDKVAQTVNPDPQYAEQGAKPGDDGAHGAAASERYRKGQTKPVKAMSSTSGVNAGPR